MVRWRHCHPVRMDYAQHERYMQNGKDDETYPEHAHGVVHLPFNQPVWRPEYVVQVPERPKHRGDDRQQAEHLKEDRDEPSRMGRQRELLRQRRSCDPRSREISWL